MIKIKKFEHIYGIENLIGCEKLKRINVIYAPNGTAKSSICDALLKISKCEDCNDVYNVAPNASYELDVNGEIITETKKKPFDIICYSGTEPFDIKSDNSNLINIVASSSAKASLKPHVDEIEKQLNVVKHMLETIFGKKYGTKAFEESLSSVVENNGIRGNLRKLVYSGPFSHIKPYSFSVDVDLFLNMTSAVASKAALTNEIQNECANYFNIVSKPIIDSIISDDFSLDNLQNVYLSALNENYFDDAEHRKFEINGISYNKEGIKDIIDDKETMIYGTREARESFAAVNKHLKKGNLSKFRECLEKNKQLISELTDYHSMSKRLFVSLIGYSNSMILDLARVTIEKEIKEIIKITSSNTNDNNFETIKNKYQSMFSFEKFHLDIENKLNAYLGTEIPTFVKYENETNMLIEDPKDYRFSTGEIRAYNFLNFIIETEAMRTSNAQFTIVLDDAAESFDYKNKYGIINYVKSLQDDPNIQLIIMTHNFDFYRSIILAFGERNVECFFAYKDKLNNVQLYESKNGYYINIANFNMWKNNPDSKKFVALIPFARTILQLQDNHDSNIDIILKYLHYDVSSESLQMNDVINLLTNNLNVNLCPSTISASDCYLKLLNNLSSNICGSNIKETNLEDKIVVGLYLRIFLERFLTKRYIDSTRNNPTITDNHRRTRELYTQCEPYLSQEEKEIIETINVVCPPYVHVNSFMYEPLIDVGGDELKKQFLSLSALNSSWPL